MRRNKIREDDIQTVFSYFDKNGDQTIDQDEFSQACDHLDLGFNEQEKKAMFE
jgi:Ca2+-binding EF-hand superfamily protein